MTNNKANAELRAMLGKHKYGELADEVGVHWVTISEWFRTEENMTRVRRLRILDALKRMDERAEQEAKGKQ